MGTKKGITAGQHSFSQVPSVSLERSTFDRSSGTKTTFDAGFLIPIFIDEVLPGDTFNMNTSLFARINTLLFPVMDNIYLDMFYFYVPNRLLWDNWEKFMGAQDNPGDSTSFLVPTMTMATGSGNSLGSLHDYLGIPIGVPDLVINSLYHRAYNLIWNEWFRSEDLQNSVVVDTDDGPDTETDYVILRRGKRHDYFTSCLPSPQKGVAVTLPLGSTAPVTGTITGHATSAPAFAGTTSGTATLTGSGGTSVVWSGNLDGAAKWDDPQLTLTSATADLSAATAATINQIREAFQIQRLLERDQRGGTRYTEILQSHFGVTSPDQRVQRPEFLGGGSAPIIVTPVAETARGGSGIVAELSAYGVAQTSGIGFVKSFVEHGVILGLVASRADINYSQGTHRSFFRSTKLDYYWPALAHLGEQAVLTQELWTMGSDDTTDDDVFGYQERFAEYRYKPSMITNKLRSVPSSGSLDVWHLAQEFSTVPLLNAAFIEENPPLDRVVSIPAEPHFILDSFFRYKCARAMPTYSVPGQVDHF